MTAAQPRSIARIIHSPQVVEGEGFIVQRPFPSHALMDFDPFLLFDHFGPMEFGPGEAKGASDHPHRGFEAISYLLEGSLAHRDSLGHSGQLRPGDVQWMTTGSGLIHSEMPPADFLRDGGRLQGVQLWVNLPAADKMTPPRYADVPSEQIPVAVSEDRKITVKVLSGSAFGVQHTLGNHVPITYLHATLAPGAQWEQPVPTGHNALAYVLSGEARLGAEEQSAGAGQLALFARVGDTLRIQAISALSVLVLAGAPLGEPVARYGPFVMNTETEIRQAITDFRAGKMGVI